METEAIFRWMLTSSSKSLKELSPAGLIQSTDPPKETAAPLWRKRKKSGKNNLVLRSSRVVKNLVILFLHSAKKAATLEQRTKCDLSDKTLKQISQNKKKHGGRRVLMERARFDLKIFAQSMHKTCFTSSCMAKHISIGKSVVLHLCEGPELRMCY